jgi:hypothetical protein
VAQQAATPIVERDPGLVAGRLDSQHAHRNQSGKLA